MIRSNKTIGGAELVLETGKLAKQADGACVVTLGERGAYAVAGSREARVPGRSIAVVDTIGSGDAFSARWFLDLRDADEHAAASLLPIGTLCTGCASHSSGKLALTRAQVAALVRGTASVTVTPSSGDRLRGSPALDRSSLPVKTEEEQYADGSPDPRRDDPEPPHQGLLSARTRCPLCAWEQD